MYNVKEFLNIAGKKIADSDNKLPKSTNNDKQQRDKQTDKYRQTYKNQ